MSAHTPGPWYVAAHYGNGISVKTSHKEDDTTLQSICTVAYRSARKEGSFANAALIAAAPELLEALELISQEASDHLRCVSPTDSEWEFLRRCVDKAREVIAKARGAA